MTTFYLILTIALIDFLSILSPGQDFAIVTRNTLKYSRRIGYYTVLGIGLVTLFHTLLAMIGISALVAKYPDTLTIIKTAGALYLIYLGTGFVKNARNFKPTDKQEESKSIQPTISAGAAFKMGAIANLLNVEPILAFISVFALLLPTETALWIKFTVCLFLTFNTMVWLALVTRLFSLAKVQCFLQTRLKIFERVIGILLILLGSKNLISIRSHS